MPVVVDSCVEVLPTIPDSFGAPDYRALAVLLDAYCWKTVQGARPVADAMRAAVKQGAAVDKCIATCVMGLEAAERYLAKLWPLPQTERFRSIHDGLAAMFRDGSDVPAAYTTGCPEGSIRNVEEAAIVAMFRYVYAVLDLMEIALAQVFSDGSMAPNNGAAAMAGLGASSVGTSGDDNCTMPTKERSNDFNCGGAKQ